MKKISIILITALFFGACSSERSTEDIKNEIFEYKEKIKLLEKELHKNPDAVFENSIKVKIIEAKKTKVKHSFSSTGTAKAVNMAFISPEMNGQIKRIYVKEGQFVKKGQLLVTLNSDVILSSIKELKTGLELAKVLYEKQKTLWEQKIGKEIDYLQAKNQKESLEAKLATVNAQYQMSIITAPFSGIVDEIYFKKGEMAMPGRQVIDLVNLNIMEVEADISEKYLPYIKKGDSVTVKFPTYPDLIKIATINRTGNIINRANRTFKVVVKIENKDKKIKPNMIAKIILSDYSGENYAIPSIIIKSDRKGNYIFIAKEENGKFKAEKRYIKTGMHTGNNTIVESGINEGEKIIAEGYNLINSGTTVEIVK
ncbi:MAG: efflux RND transporter periplasmic adaptor subunit [Bacteroidales bacterium]|nr:efflux RND transporter periplasmic adaptor subunit [Bacteroidales bacterium]